MITDSGSSDGTDFILSQHAFTGMGQSADAGAALLTLGYVGIEYRRCVNTIDLSKTTVWITHLVVFVRWHKKMKNFQWLSLVPTTVEMILHNELTTKLTCCNLLDISATGFLVAIQIRTLSSRLLRAAIFPTT